MIALDTLCEYCNRAWLNTDDAYLDIDKISYDQQQENEHKIWDLLSNKERFKQSPDRLMDYIKQDHIWNLPNLSKTHQEQFCQITRQFMMEARAFDGQLEDASIFQALRNVWIILMLEMMLDHQLHYHPAIFAYSMLYPYTDNYLDDLSESQEAKEHFNYRLHQRLKGFAYDRPNEREGKIDQLISKIESVYDRNQYPDVYESLLCIQKGQEDSLKQSAWRDDLLYISIQKGGSSVLADGFLIHGHLKEEDQRFCMEYGFALQLADDLQDIKEDRESGHNTLFSHHSAESLAKRLLQYVSSMLQRQTICREKELCAIIEKGCQFLVLGSIIMHHEEFTPAFMRDVFARFPITQSGLKKLITSHACSFRDCMNLFEQG